MKHIICILFFFTIIQTANCGKGIGVSLGGGYYNYFGDKPSNHEFKELEGPAMLAGVQIPLVESYLTELELNMFLFWRGEQRAQIVNEDVEYVYKTLRQNSQSLAVRFYLFDYQSFVRPSIHIGTCSFPILSWSLGLGCDVKIYENYYVQFAGWYLVDGFSLLVKKDIPPAFLTISLKHYFR